MILNDFSQLCIANIVQFPEEFKKGTVDAKAAINLVRHSTLSTLLSYKKTYGAQYGGLVIATDGNNYWRREVFPEYKHSRKKMRSDSDLDWKLINDVMNQFKEEFMQVFHYPVIRVPRAEADDVIAVMCEYTQENELVTTDMGLEVWFPEPQMTLILSSDGDFKQLQKYKNVRQWSPLLKKWVVASKEGIAFDLMEKIVKGDPGDGIPNIYMPDDHFVNGEARGVKRQKSVMAARLAQFVVGGNTACVNDDERKNFKRNQTLVDLSFIPEDVKDDIVADYIAKKNLKADRQRILSYFHQHRMRQLIDSIQDF